MRVFAMISSLALSVALLAGCGASTASTTPLPTAGMDNHQMASSTVPYDATFIDAMIMHHQGAVAMAEQAKQSAEHTEIKQLADTIITAQNAEIEKMKGWRTAWYPSVAATSGMPNMSMGTMMVADGEQPYDLRFIAAMIPHHESAIAMAHDALAHAEHQEIKDLAQAIIRDQQREIDQMKQWQTEWFN